MERSIEIYELTVDGELKITRLGNPAGYTETIPQHTVTRGNWFVVKTTGLLSLCGCSVSPGFEFVDFELGKGEELIATFPAYEAVIRAFARDTHFESDAAHRDGFVGTLTHPAAGGQCWRSDI